MEISGDVHTKIDAQRRELHRKILSWRIRQSEHMPDVSSFFKDNDAALDNDVETEKICLYLPSDFSQDDRCHLNLSKLTGLELKLRKAEANDALHELQVQINFNLSLEVQKRRVRYTKNLT